MTLYHGTSSPRWASIQRDGVLRVAPFGDQCISLTDSREVADYFAANACSGDEGGSPVILTVNADGLNAAPFVSAVWDDCSWERETACWEDIPLDRVEVVQ